jgi:4-carboxymuconolactone decarboxylase
LREGVPKEAVEAIKHHRSTAGLDAADAVVIDLGREIFAARSVSPETYARALAQFGPGKLVDLVALMGNYASTAALLTAFAMQLDPGQQKLPPRAEP